jgi:hypothetical protein
LFRGVQRTDCDLRHFGSLPIESNVSNGDQDVGWLVEIRKTERYGGTRYFLSSSVDQAALWGFVRFGARRAKFSHVVNHVQFYTSYFDS